MASFTVVIGRQRKHTHRAPDWRSGLQNAARPVRAVLSGVEDSKSRYDFGTDSGSVARHRSAPVAPDSEGRQHSWVVFPIPKGLGLNVTKKNEITRRDFLYGVARSLAVGTSLSPMEILARSNGAGTAA